MDKLAVVEVLDRDGRVRSIHPVHSWPVRMGRSLDCDVLLDDPHVAPLHLTLTGAEGDTVDLQVGETVNGVQCARQRLSAGETAKRKGGEEWLLGHTRVRVRLKDDPLAPELPVPRASRWGYAALAALLCGLVGWTAWETYLDAEPGEFLTQFTPVTAGLLALVAAWSFLWALGSKLFQHRLDYLTHVRIASAGLLGSSLLGAVLGVLAFSTSLESLSRIRGATEAIVLALAVFAHLVVVMPQRRRAFAWIVSAGVLTGLSLTALLQYNRSGRLTEELYLTTLPPPAFRLAPAVSPKAFIEEAASLKDSLDRRAADADDAADAGEVGDESRAGRSR